MPTNEINSEEFKPRLVSDEIEAQEPVNSPQPQPPIQTRHFFWPIVCLFQFGLIIGGIMWGRSSVQVAPNQPDKSSVYQPAPAAARVPEPKPTVIPKLAGESLERGDDLVLEGNYEAALAVYQPPGGGIAPAFHASLQYRIALCQEALGHWDQALGSYRAVSSYGRSITSVAAGQLGQARIWIRMRKFTDAKKLLCDLTLRSGLPALREHPLLADSQYLLALTEALENLHEDKPGPANEALAAYALTDWPLERVLKWADAEQVIGKSEGNERRQESVSVRRVGKGPEKCAVTAALEQADIPELFEKIAEPCGLKVQWTPAARQLVQARTVTVVVERLPLPDLLLALTAPLGLVAETVENELTVSSEPEMPRPARTAYVRQKARRMLRDVAVAHPGHSLTPAAYLELGNLEASEEKWNDAITWYVRLVRELPRSPVLADAHYNLGVAQRKLGNNTESRTWFYRVVDGAPGSELAPLAYFRIGRLFLDEGDAEHALSPLRRAAAAGAGTSTQPIAALTLAAAYLLTSHPRAANSVLADYREPLAEPYRPLAAFIDALAKYRVLTDRKRASREGADLLAALLATENSSLLGPAGNLLAGEAYGDLGMGEQKMQLYEKLAQEAKSPHSAQATFTLAESLFAAKEREAAKRLFTSLISSSNIDLASHARFRLAELALQDGRPAECLEICRELIRAKSSIEPGSLLKMIGTAFDQLGQHRQAALCFAGQMPREFSNPTASPPAGAAGAGP
jgi:tetratricopeptide (TPR) repeat protein